MLRNFFTCLFFITLLSGCGDEGVVNRTLPLTDETVPAAPSWTPDAITIDELIFPYAAKHAVGIDDIAGEEFRLAACEVLYRSRRVRRSERENRWVRLSTGSHPPHATRWTHNGIPQFIYFFLNFRNESDFQRFGVGRHENVRFIFTDALKLRENTWEISLMYQNASTDGRPIDNTPVERSIPADTSANPSHNDAVEFTAIAETGYFWSGSTRLYSLTLTGLAYDVNGLTLRAAAGQRIQDGLPAAFRLAWTQRSAPHRRNRFGRRIEFTHADLRYSGNYAYIQHVDITQEQSKDLRLMGEDIAPGDVFHLYVYPQ